MHCREAIWQYTEGSFGVKGTGTEKTYLASMYRWTSKFRTSFTPKSTETGLTNSEGRLRLFSPPSFRRGPRRRFPSRRGPGYLWVLSCIPQALLSAPPFPPWLTAEPHTETRNKRQMRAANRAFVARPRVARFSRLTSCSSTQSHSRN